MNNNILLEKIEISIFNWYIDKYPEFSVNLQNQLDSVVEIEREFTGVGAFISFKFDNVMSLSLLKEKYHDNIIIDGLALYSVELQHPCPITLHLNKNGIIDYIEFEFGFLEKKYPKKYKLNNLIYKSIIDKKLY